jgi:hypothetical protein
MPSLSAVHAGAEASNASVETPIIASFFYLATYRPQQLQVVAVELNRRSPDGEWALLRVKGTIKIQRAFAAVLRVVLCLAISM